MPAVLLSPSSPPDCPELSMEDWDHFYEMGNLASYDSTFSDPVDAAVMDPKFTPTEEDIQFWEKLEAYSQGFRS